MKTYLYPYDLFKFLGIFLFITNLSLSSLAFKGFVYEKSTNRTKTLYTIERVESIVKDQESLTIKHIEPDNSLAVEEVALFNKNELIEYTLNYPKQNELGKIVIKEGKAHFSYIKNNKEKKSVEKIGNNFVVGLSMNKFVESNWDELVKGQKLDIRFGVPDRRESVGFSLFRTKEQEKQEGVMVIKMKPTSFIIAALVDPVIFHYDLKTKNLLYFIGRAKPRQLVGEKWKDLDAETVYIWD